MMPIDPRQAWRTWRRKVVNRAVGLTFAYQGVMTGVSIVAGLLIGVIIALNTGSQGFSGTAYNDMANRATGILSLISVLAAFGFLLLMRHRDIFTREFWLGGPHTDTYGEPGQLGRTSHYGGGHMRPLWFAVFIALALGVQGVILLVQLGLSAIGVDLVSPTSESISESTITVSMWLYVGLVGPICEEVLFRGVLMKELKPLGKNFAIVTSALVFGLFHDDVVQGTFAFLLGLVLGFVAMEYSLIWSIALHIFNNAILSGVVDTLASTYLDNNGYMIYMIALMLLGIIASILVFVFYGKGLGQYRRENRSVPDTYCGWASGAFIAFVIVNALIAIVSFVSAMFGSAMLG
jgi:membrane protease YdiL (CAAX protease family)